MKRQKYEARFHLGGILPYISHIGMCRPKSSGIDFAHFGLELGMVYEGTTIVYQCVRRFSSK